MADKKDEGLSLEQQHDLLDKLEQLFVLNTLFKCFIEEQNLTKEFQKFVVEKNDNYKTDNKKEED